MYSCVLAIRCTVFVCRPHETTKSSGKVLYYVLLLYFSRMLHKHIGSTDAICPITWECHGGFVYKPCPEFPMIFQGVDWRK